MDNSISANQLNMRVPAVRGDAVATAANSAAGPVAGPGAVPAVTDVQPPRELPSSGEGMNEMLEGLSERLNQFVQDNARELEFRVNDEGGRIVILVRQSETGEVLRTIPPEEALDLVNNLGDGAAALVSQLA